MSESLSTSARLRQLLPELFKESALTGERYLRYQITPDISALMAMTHVRESQLINRDQITPLPQMLPYVMGLCSSREKVFLTIDLPQLLYLPSALVYARRYHVIVINVADFLPTKNTSELWLGLAVDKIQGITRISEQNLTIDDSSLTQIEPKIVTYVEKLQQDKEQILPILNLQKIISLTN
ncbi:MAG: chemotaxis protein CheW [Cyanobacterium sp. T60_A2020_053]|nr:chemotaxis protein CheW [Cyanobacterium sp. T60_A2020_053]